MDNEERQRQQKRREAVQKARDALWLGATLAKQRDDRKRSYFDMDTTEQQTLEEYDTGRTEKAKQSSQNPKDKTVSLPDATEHEQSVNCNATEHASSWARCYILAFQVRNPDPAPDNSNLKSRSRP